MRCVFAAVVLASCARVSSPAKEDPGAVLALHANEGEDADRLGRALTTIEEPQLVFVGEIAVSLLRSDGTAPERRVHPQGLAWMPKAKRWAISAVEMGDADRDGRAWIFFTDAIGNADASATVALPVRNGAFHPGGIDVFGDAIYVSLSPYAPNTRADLLRVRASNVEVVGAVPDHLGVVAVSSGASQASIRAASWDAARWYTIDLDGNVVSSMPRPVALALQDGQGLAGTDRVVFTGLVNPGATSFGLVVARAVGSELAVERTILWSSHPYLTPQGRAPFHNATHLWIDREGRVWALTMPDDQDGPLRSALRLYRIEPRAR